MTTMHDLVIASKWEVSGNGPGQRVEGDEEAVHASRNQ